MPNHPIVHVELPATDPAQAAKFYAEAFDWKVEADPTFDYHMFRAEGGPGGGFVKIASDAGTGASTITYKAGEPLIYIGTDDIDATLRRVESLGGKTLLPKTEIPQMGWWAVFADPTGNRIGLFTGVEQPAQGS